MRVLVGALYLILTLGAVAMVYPFLVMLGASTELQYEKSSPRDVPRYLYSETALFGKYAEDKYQGDMDAINAAYGTSYVTLQDIKPPAVTDPNTVRGLERFCVGPAGAVQKRGLRRRGGGLQSQPAAGSDTMRSSEPAFMAISGRWTQLQPGRRRFPDGLSAVRAAEQPCLDAGTDREKHRLEGV